MVVEVSATHTTKEAEPEERAHRQTLVDETVVDEHVPEAEERHADARADEHGAREAVELAPGDDQPGGDRRVEDRERVVALESSSARLVVRAMHGPERAMPDSAVEPTRPGLHRTGDHDGNERSGGDVERAHRGWLP